MSHPIVDLMRAFNRALLEAEPIELRQRRENAKLIEQAKKLREQIHAYCRDERGTAERRLAFLNEIPKLDKFIADDDGFGAAELLRSMLRSLF